MWWLCSVGVKARCVQKHEQTELFCVTLCEVGVPPETGGTQDAAVRTEAGLPPWSGGCLVKPAVLRCFSHLDAGSRNGRRDVRGFIHPPSTERLLATGTNKKGTSLHHVVRSVINSQWETLLSKQEVVTALTLIAVDAPLFCLESPFFSFVCLMCGHVQFVLLLLYIVIP